MKVLAYCAASFEESVIRAAGVKPLLSPPINLARFDPRWLTGYEFLYFKLHGLPSEQFWYGDKWQTALSADQLRQANLTGAVVFVANCHLYQLSPVDPTITYPGPMLTALLAAGAYAVAGGPGINYARSSTVHGADRLGLHFRRWLERGFPPKLAFSLAKAQLRAKLIKDEATRDALAFHIFTRHAPRNLSADKAGTNHATRRST